MTDTPAPAVAPAAPAAPPAFVSTAEKDFGEAVGRLKSLPWALIRSPVFIAGMIALVVIGVGLFVSIHAGVHQVDPTPIAQHVTKPVAHAAQAAAVCQPNVHSALDTAVTNFEHTHGSTIKAFQKANGLTPDGIIGPGTFQAFINKAS